MATKNEKKRGLIIVSNRLPLSVKEDNGTYKSSLSSGGLVTALSGLTKSTNFRWFGWPGKAIEDPEEQKKVSDALEENSAVGIFLSEQLAHDHYNKFSSMHLSSIPYLSPSHTLTLTTHRLCPLAYPPLPIWGRL